MKTTKPSQAPEFVTSEPLVAANEPTMPELRKEQRAEAATSAKRGWDPYDVWRTRVKTSRHSDAPAL